LESCPFCHRTWDQHSTRCADGVPAVDLNDDQGLSGKVISGYKILGRIGQGGMGTVYLALDNITEGQLDAVKVLNRDWLAERERLRREAVTANRVDHPNVCRIYNYVEAHDSESGKALTLVAMELVRGPTLREIQEERGGTLDPDRAALVVKEVASALQAIHSQKIVHRDIKPTNIIVTTDPDGTERVKIVDFGIAKKVGGGAGQDLTEPGMVAATMHYASPEQLRGKPDERCDIYALLAEVQPDKEFPQGLQGVIDRALERDLSKRYSTAREFSDAVMRTVSNLAQTVRVPISEIQAADAIKGPRPGPAKPATPPSPATGPPPASHEAPGPAPPPASRQASEPSTARAPAPSRTPASSRVPALTDLWKDPKVKWGGGGVILALSIVLFVGFGGLGFIGGLFSSPSPPSPEGQDPGATGREALAGIPARIDLFPDSFQLSVGDTVRLDPEVTDALGNLIPEASLTWSSSNPGVVGVDDSGTSVALSSGFGIVTASTGSLATQAMVVVLAAPAPPPDVGPSPQRLCPDPAFDVLDGLEASMGDPSTSQGRLRDIATACWNREEDLGDAERAYAAWLIGQITYGLEGCRPNATRWFQRAVGLDPGSQAYRVALDGCGG